MSTGEGKLEYGLKTVSSHENVTHLYESFDKGTFYICLESAVEILAD